jgi:glycosyltransferase involved in cell wall biosynthesis
MHAIAKNLVIACQTCGYLMRDMIRAYSEAGYTVTLISSQDSWDGIKKELPKSVGHRKVIAYDRSSTIKRLLTWSFCALQMWWKVLVHHHKDEILYVSNPPFSPLLPLALGNKFSLLIWDIYPDVLVSQHVFGKESRVVKWWAKKNNKVFSQAKHVFTISDGMKDCLKKYGSDEKMKVVPLWPDGMMLRVDKSENLFIKEQKLEGKFVVMYSGNLGNTHRMDVLLDVAQLVHNEDVVFLLIGEGGKKKMIEERIEKEKIRNVRLLPFQPLEMLPHSLSAADIAVVTLDYTSSQMSVPSKTFNLMAVGAPLMCIASPDSELGNLVKKYDVGAIYPPESAVEMAKFVIHLKAEEQVKNRYRTNAMVAAHNYTSENAKMFVETI